MSTPSSSAQPDNAARTKRAVIVVFARLPVPGQVKTRLAAGVGPEAAAAFYKLCAEHACLEVLRCSAADGVVFCAASADAWGVADWLTAAGTPLPVYPQVQDPDLGRRMIAALTAAATAGGTQLQGAVTPATAPGQGPAVPAYEAAIVIGTDIPDLSSEVLSAAVEALLGRSPQGEHSPALGTAAEPVADVVLGPSADGGYYLLGFRTEALLLPGVQSGKVFEGVEWSCSTVLQKTVEAVEGLGLRVASTSRLPMLRDIDTKEDAAEWLLRCRLDVDAVQGPSLQGQMAQLVREWL